MTTDQAAPAADDPQAAQGHADAIAHLLFRAACGVLKAEEGALLRTLVEQQRDAGDSLAGGVSASAAAYARRYEKAARRLRKARQQRDEARAEADRLRRTIEHIAEAPLNVDVWTRIGMALGWTPERAGTEARKRRLHGEQTLAQRAVDATERLAAAKAEAEGLAETMRNTDRLTEQQLAQVRAERDQAATSLADIRNDLYAERRTHEEHRRELAAILNAGRETAWSALLGQVAARNADWARRIAAAERAVAADVAAARQAEEVAAREYSRRRQQLADALGCEPDTSWPDIAETARRMFEAGPVRRSAVVDAEQQVRAARQAEAEAVRARQAAEAREQQTAATLRETETQLGQARKVRDQHAGTIERMKRTNRMVNGGAREALERAEQAEAALARVREVMADDFRDDHRAMIEAALAEPEPKPREVCCVCRCPDVTYHNHREQPFCCRCAMCCEPPTLCAHGCQPPAEAEHVCPDGEPCPGHDQPAEAKPTPPPVPEGAELWAAIRDHAARDTAWWDRIERMHRNRSRIADAARVRP